MLIGSFSRTVLFVGLSVVGAGDVYSQNYPSKPVRIVTGAAGGGGDVAARLIAQGLTGSLGQSVFVDNRGGAGVIVSDVVAKAPADGYTILLYGSPHWLLPFMRAKVPYDPVRDFAPITLAVSQPNILIVHPSLPVKSVKELIALAKSRRGEFNYATSSTGGSNHLAGELFKAMAGVDIVRINYKGAGPALTSLMGGEVHLMFATAAAAMPQVQSGKLRALAITSAKPSPLAPDLPTVAASGLPGYESVGMYGLWVPAGTSAEIVNRLNHEIVQIMHRADVKEKYYKLGVETVGNSPEQFAVAMKSEMNRLGKLLKDLGIKDE